MNIKKHCIAHRILSLVCASFVAFTCTACSSAPADKKDTYSVVATVFPVYDWVKEVAGEDSDIELTMLLDSGVDLHSYQPTVEDIAKIATCDMFVYVGGESDGWVENALGQSVNKDMIVVNLLDVLGDAVVEEEHVEGMEEGDEESDEPESDEHVWLSLRNAQAVCSYLAKELGNMDKDNAQVYLSNAERYCEALNDLDQQYAEAVTNAQYNTLLFADRFPFRYMAKDYGLSYFAAFSGCSAETEASVETIAFLANKLKKLDLPAVMIIDGSDEDVAATVIETAGLECPILALNSLQSVTSENVASGATYLGIMQENLSVLEQALNDEPCK